MNRPTLIILLGFVTIWDTITTIYGTTVILGTGTIQVMIAILFALLLTGYLLQTIPITKNPKEDFVTSGAKILWFIAFLYDLFTSFTGNMDFVLGNATGSIKIIFAIGLTVMVCSCPIGLSKLMYDPE